MEGERDAGFTWGGRRMERGGMQRVKEEARARARMDGV